MQKSHKKTPYNCLTDGCRDKLSLLFNLNFYHYETSDF